MPVLSAHIVPHPPMIVPAIGRGREAEIDATIRSYHNVAKQIAEQRPDTIIIISPHTAMYSDYFHISPGERALGSFAQFGAASVNFDERYDTVLVERLCGIAAENGLAAGTDGERSPELDHGVMVPLYFTRLYYGDFKLVRIGVSGLSLDEHYRLGMCVKEAASDRSVVIIGSGDLSHRLKSDGPYGFNASGPVFDRCVTEVMKTGNFAGLFDLDAELCNEAGECGLRPFTVLAGALDETPINADFHSYEGPFGVGYALASYKVETNLHTFLARYSLQHFLRTGEYLNYPGKLPGEFYEKGYGAFVSIKKNGQLRGCIGTITGVQENLMQEIITNAVSAGTQDPRFRPITEDELEQLVFSVDVLMPAEPVSDKSQLNQEKYGVIVSSGFKRGLLLPNLEGVDSVDGQLGIALQKAGIRQSENYQIQRFEVVRHQ